MYKVLHIPTGTFVYTNFYGSIGLYSLEEVNKYININNSKNEVFPLLLVSSQSEFENIFHVKINQRLCPIYFGYNDNEISHYELIDINE